MRDSINTIIEKTSVKTAQEVVRCQQLSLRTNHYKDTERLLRNYKSLLRLYENPDDVLFKPKERSHSITATPPKGTTKKSHDEVKQEEAEQRVSAYEVSRAQFNWLQKTIESFASKPEFIIIRMYYFGEDAHGNDIGRKHPTFEEIAFELEEVGMARSERTLRQWRTQIVQDMAVCLFVVDGTLSIGGGAMQYGADSQNA